MPPSDTTPQSTIRYLTRILAALAKSHGGELRVKRRLLRQVEDETSRQVLLEDLDSKKDEIVLRFGSKHSAIYPVEAESSNQSSQAKISQPSPQPAAIAQPKKSRRAAKRTAVHRRTIDESRAEDSADENSIGIEPREATSDLIEKMTSDGESARGMAGELIREIGEKFVKARKEGRSGAWGELEDQLMLSAHIIISAGLMSPKDWVSLAIDIEQFRKSRLWDFETSRRLAFRMAVYFR